MLKLFDFEIYKARKIFAVDLAAKLFFLFIQFYDCILVVDLSMISRLNLI